AAVGAVPDFRLREVANLLVVPVDQVHVAVRAALDRQRDRPLVIRQEEVRVAVRDVAAALRRNHIDVDAVAVQVPHEPLAVLLLPRANTSNTCFVGWYRQMPALIGTRSASGVPGLPTRLCVNTPWQP